MALQNRARRAREIVRNTGGCVVALSGGVDSGVLLALAAQALGPDRVLAMTGRSPSLPASDLADARAVAAWVGVHHEIVDTDELGRPGYRANLGDRCYHCRSELFEIVFDRARKRRMGAVAYGAITDDLGDDRPGMRAAEERGVLAPLLTAGLDKADVRRLAADVGLPVRDKPAAACLASRIPAGLEVTPERLAAVDRAEQALRSLGLRVLRVRHEGDRARIELGPEELRRAEAPEPRRSWVEAVREAGFRRVTIDPRGYRPGGAQRGAQLVGIRSLRPD